MKKSKPSAKNKPSTPIPSANNRSIYPHSAMFQRVIHENWASIVPIISFAVTAGIFLLVSIRALTLSKSRREELANIPFEENSNADH